MMRTFSVSAGFNPRSREGSDNSGEKYSYYVTVSIRAPVKGATGRCSRGGRKTRVSIRAPVKGATSHSTNRKLQPGFQSALP